jgi:hypothetical protein
MTVMERLKAKWLMFIPYVILFSGIFIWSFSLNNFIMEAFAIALLSTGYLSLILNPLLFYCEDIRKHFLPERGLYLKGKHYFANVNSKLSRASMATLKIMPLSLITALFMFAWFQREKIAVLEECEKAIDEFLFIRGNIGAVGAFIVAFLGINVTAFWNIDQIFGRVWQYCCGVYKDLITTGKDDKQKRDIIRVNLCIDILDHDMWNTSQFRTFFRLELERVYFLFKRESVIYLRCKEDIDRDGVHLDNFIAEMELYLKAKYDGKVGLWTFTFDELRSIFSWLSCYVEEEVENVSAAAPAAPSTIVGSYKNTLPSVKHMSKEDFKELSRVNPS